MPETEHLEPARKRETARAVETHLDPAPRFSRIAHAIRHRGIRQLAALAALVTAALSTSALLWPQPDAIGNTLIDIARNNVSRKPFHRECISFGAPLADINAVNPDTVSQRGQVDTTCDDVRIADIAEKHSEPLFLLGEPGVGKRLALFKIQKQMTDRGVPSVFVTAKDCVPFIRTGKTLRKCIDATVIEAIGQHASLPIERREHAAAEFLRRKDWWLLIDGIDDVGDSMQIGAAVRELNDLHQWHGSKIAVSGKGETIAHTMYLIPNGETIREVFTHFSRIFVHGLHEDGSAEMQARLVNKAAPDRQAETNRRFASLNSIKSCTDHSGRLAAEILRRPSFILDTHRSQEFPRAESCGQDTCAALAKWIFDVQFDSYCTDICGDGDHRSEIQFAASRYFDELRRHPVTSISRTSIINTLNESTMRAGPDDVMRALLGAGILTASGPGSYNVRAERICAQPAR